jgi:SAM-dependent methyltransferase
MKQISTACIACGASNEPYIDEIWDDRYGAPGKFSILKCADCGQMVTSPLLAEQDLPALDSRCYPRGHVDFAVIEREADLVLQSESATIHRRNGTDDQGHYFVKPGQKMLDIGCGPGVLLLEIRNLDGVPWGIETDPNVQTIADHFGLNVHIGSIHDNPFPGEHFNVIVLKQVIGHVPDPVALLKLIREILWLEGRVILGIQTMMPNLWTILQLRAYVHETVEVGRPGPGPDPANLCRIGRSNRPRPRDAGKRQWWGSA